MGQEELGKLLKEIRKKYEDDAILFQLDDFKDETVIPISSGSISFDVASGIGGVPCGRVIEIYGLESSGKSTLCNHIAANAQKAGRRVAFIDTEQSMDYGYMQKCGVNTEDLLVSQPDSLNRGLNLTEDLIRSNEVQLIIFDSVVGVSPDKEKEDGLGDYNVSLISKLLTQYFRRNLSDIKKNNVALVFTNQARDKIGSYFQMIETTGGHAFKHSAAMRIETSKGKVIGEKESPIGIECKAVFKKNKLAAPYRVANYSIYFDKGIWKSADIVTNAITAGIIQQRGSFFLYNNEKIAQGEQNTINLLDQTPEFLDKIEKELRKTLGL